MVGEQEWRLSPTMLATNVEFEQMQQAEREASNGRSTDWSFVSTCRFLSLSLPLSPSCSSTPPVNMSV